MNVNVAAIVSPRSKVSPTGGEPKTKPPTPGAPWLASTLWAAAFAIAWCPSAKLAFVVVSPDNAIFPPFNVSALAPMLNPSASASDTCTR